MAKCEKGGMQQKRRYRKAMGGRRERHWGMAMYVVRKVSRSHVLGVGVVMKVTGCYNSL